MTGFDEFSKRIQKLRKDKSMTQEELADRLGVTSQAVSKWETGLSYPDITLFPTIAAIFGVDTDFLFGIIKPEPDQFQMMKFPDKWEGMKLVHLWENAACYSEKAVAKADGSGVKFTDGSTAELSSGLIFNAGAGDIKIMFAENNFKYNNIDYSKTSLELDFGYTDSVDISVIANICRVTASEDSRTHILVKGQARFIALLDITAEDKTLCVKFKENEDKKFDDYKSNIIEIRLPCGQKGDRAKIRINGQGNAESELDFNEGDLKINGSGNIKSQSIDKSYLKINGSGNISIKNCPDADIKINGSGDIRIEDAVKSDIKINGSGDVKLKIAGGIKVEINGSGNLTADEADSLSSKISGSGDIKIKKLNGGDISSKISGSGDLTIGGGRCGLFDIDAAGSCEVDAAGLSARKAAIILRDNGKVVLGRVRESSTEQIKKKGTIKILNRGEETV